MDTEKFKELWANRNIRIAIIAVLISPIAYFGSQMVFHKGTYARPDREATKIEKVFMPETITAELKRQDLDGVREQLVDLSAIDKKSNATNTNFRYDQLEQEMENLRNQMAASQAEITQWRTGQKQLERRNYDPNQIRQQNLGQAAPVSNVDSEIASKPKTLNDALQQSAEKRTASAAIVGIREVTASSDSILLQNGQVRTLVEANTMVTDETEVTKSERRKIMKEKEKELAQTLSGLKDKKVDDSYTISLPTTSVLTATLISGMQAPTSLGSKREPLPAMVRFKVDALLPNGYRADLRDCQGLVSGVGQLSDRRAYMRLETITCIDDKGLTAESAAQGYATGSDGQAGIPGRLIARNDEVLKGSMWAGFFSGLASGIAPTRISGLDVTGNGGYQNVDMGALGTSAMLNGTSSSLDRISEYYVKMLEEIWPTVDVPPMQEVTFILQAPLRLTFKEV